MRQLAFTIALVAALGGSRVNLAQTKPDYLLFTDPGRRFAIEFPREWRWLIITGSGEPLATFTHPRGEAAVVVERFRMKLKLEADEITEQFAQIEAEYLKENQPLISGVSASVLSRGRRRVVVVDYLRPRPPDGGMEKVRHYAFPVGGDLYRLTCMALTPQFSRYEATFLAMAESLKAAGEIGPPR